MSGGNVEDEEAGKEGNRRRVGRMIYGREVKAVG